MVQRTNSGDDMGAPERGMYVTAPTDETRFTPNEFYRTNRADEHNRTRITRQGPTTAPSQIWNRDGLSVGPTVYEEQPFAITGSGVYAIFEKSVTGGTSWYHKLDKDDGSNIWDSPPAGDVTNELRSVYVQDGAVYLTGDAGIIKLNDTDGSLEWSNTGFVVDSPPRKIGNLVFYSESSNNRTVAVDDSDGSIEWTFGNPSSIVSTTQNNIIAYSGSTIYGLGIETGNVNWSTGFSNFAAFSGISVDGTIGYIADGGSSDRVISIDLTDGSILWDITLQTASFFIPIPSLLDDSYIVLSTNNYTMESRAKSDGSFNWDRSFSFPNPDTGEVINDGNRLYTIIGHTVHCIDPSDGSDIFTFNANTQPPTSEIGAVTAAPDGDRIYVMAGLTENNDPNTTSIRCFEV